MRHSSGQKVRILAWLSFPKTCRAPSRAFSGLRGAEQESESVPAGQRVSRARRANIIIHRAKSENRHCRVGVFVERDQESEWSSTRASERVRKTSWTQRVKNQHFLGLLQVGISRLEYPKLKRPKGARSTQSAGKLRSSSDWSFAGEPELAIVTQPERDPDGGSWVVQSTRDAPSVISGGCLHRQREADRLEHLERPSGTQFERHPRPSSCHFWVLRKTRKEREKATNWNRVESRAGESSRVQSSIEMREFWTSIDHRFGLAKSSGEPVSCQNS